MEYVLIWIIFGHYSIATESQEFGNKASCEAAKTTLIQESSRWHGRELKTYCVPKR